MSGTRTPVENRPQVFASLCNSSAGRYAVSEHTLLRTIRSSGRVRDAVALALPGDAVADTELASACEH